MTGAAWMLLRNNWFQPVNWRALEDDLSPAVLPGLSGMFEASKKPAKVQPQSEGLT